MRKLRRITTRIGYSYCVGATSIAISSSHCSPQSDNDTDNQRPNSRRLAHRCSVTQSSDRGPLAENRVCRGLVLGHIAGAPTSGESVAPSSPRQNHGIRISAVAFRRALQRLPTECRGCQHSGKASHWTEAPSALHSAAPDLCGSAYLAFIKSRRSPCSAFGASGDVLDVSQAAATAHRSCPAGGCSRHRKSSTPTEDLRRSQNPPCIVGCFCLLLVAGMERSDRMGYQSTDRTWGRRH
jgi:hypothetical protein